jgi:hypothetical protein
MHDARVLALEILMLAASQPIPEVLGSIRTAEPRDTASLSRLLGAASVADGERGHLLVLDLDGMIRAAESVVIVDSHARVQLLAVDAALAPSTREISDRMLGVALALCEAYGCREVEVVGRSARDSARR